jgi:SAM-dependent methyltransferase
MIPPRPTSLAHTIAASALAPGETAIDATCGNGHDTLVLARLVGPGGRVIAIDIQQAAIENTRRSLAAAGLDDGRATLVHDCHEAALLRIAPASVAWIMFNLGYLPGGDHAVTTITRSTVAALDAAWVALRPGGVLSIACYPGHPEGAGEAAAVESWMRATAANGAARAAIYQQPFTRSPAPLLWLASRRSKKRVIPISNL